MPLGIGNSSSTFRDEASGEDTPRQSADIFNVGSKYFETLGIPLLSGRDFEPADLERDTAIINQKMAEELFGNQNPIGRRVSGNHQSYEIIGVSANAKSRTLGEEQRNCLYQFMERNPQSSIVLFGLNILVKTGGSPHLLERAVVQEIHNLDPNLAVFNTKTMDEHLLQALLIPRASAYLFGVFGIIGLTLASVGLYGVMSHSVRQRTKEIGIRRALGAQPTQVLRTVLARGMGLAMIGLVIGLGAAAAIGRLFEGYLYGIEATDQVTFVSVPILLMLIALVAVLIPARRAAGVEPTTALRYE
jgi:predicted permease